MDTGKLSTTLSIWKAYRCLPLQISTKKLLRPKLLRVREDLGVSVQGITNHKNICAFSYLISWGEKGKGEEGSKQQQLSDFSTNCLTGKTRKPLPFLGKPSQYYLLQIFQHLAQPPLSYLKLQKGHKTLSYLHFFNLDKGGTENVPNTSSSSPWTFFWASGFCPSQ